MTMSDVINPEQESLAKEAEATISEWIRMIDSQN